MNVVTRAIGTGMVNTVTDQANPVLHPYQPLTP